MKKTLLLISTVFVFTCNAQHITANLNGTFIEGVSPVNNTFYFDDGTLHSSGILFEAVDSTGAVIGSLQYTDNSPSGTKYSWANVNMGLLKPKSYVRTGTTGNIVIDSTLLSAQPFIIITKPDWLSVNNSSATATNTDTTHKIISVDCVLSLYDKTKVISDSVKLIGGAKFGVNNKFTFNSYYNYGTGTTDSTTHQDYNYSFIAFNNTVYSESLKNSPGISFNTTLDNSFNLLVKAKYKKTQELLNKKTPNYTIPTPIPGLVINLSAGLKIVGEIGGNIIFGKDSASNHYGFIKDGDTTSSFAIGGIIIGKINGSLALISDFIANVRGSLIATGKVGISYNYQTQPSPFVGTVKLGGQFQLSGAITTDNIARKVWRFLRTETQDPKMLYEGLIWPDSSNYPFKFGDGYPTALARKINTTSISSTYMNNWFFDIPTNGAQPDVSTRGNNLAVVWMEADTNYQYLKFARFDTTSNCFVDERIVVSNDSSISNPKISLLKGGDAIITWTQNRYDATNIPTTVNSFSTFVATQDIWYGIYDDSVHNIVYTARLSDSTAADGEATVSAGNGNDALITWVSRPQGSPDADVHFVNITKSGSNWLATNPTIIPNLPHGANYAVKVAYADSIRATAIWVNDPDNTDSTFNSSIWAAEWNGIQWNSPSIIVDSAKYINFKEVDLDFNEKFGALAYTYEYYDTTNNSFRNNVDAKLYDNSADVWLTSIDNVISDSLNVFKIPRISVDETGLSTVIFQSQPLFSDTSTFSTGELMVFSKDISSTSGLWIQAGNTAAINDTSHIVSFINSGFTKNKEIFVLTQESDKIVGNNYISLNGNGVFFGDNTLGLVLRVADIDNSHNLVNLPEPTCVPTGIKNNNSKINTDIVNVKNYPNPAADYTIFEYYVIDKSNVKIEILNLQGQLIETPVNITVAAGTYKTIYNTINLSNGIYLYRVTMNNYSITKKLIIAK